MRGLLGGILFALLLLGTAEPMAGALPNAERPIVNVPVALRQANWLGSRRQGSCSFAALCTGLNWQSQTEKSAEIRATCGNGQTPRSLAVEMAKRNIPFAWTVGDRDVAFLEEAVRGRRGCMVAVDFGNPHDDECHMVYLAHLDERSVCIIDSNHPTVNRWMTRQEFLANWIRTGSWAVVPLAGSPAPPLAKGA